MKSPTILCVLNEDEKNDFLTSELWQKLNSQSLPFEWVKTPLPEGTTIADHLARTGAEVLVSCWSTPALPKDLPVGGDGQLKYVCHLTGTVRNLIPRELIERGLKSSNWGSGASRTVAEGGLLLILAALRRSNYWAVAMHRDGLWKDRWKVVTESLFGRSVGLHGFGAISRELAKLLRPFGGKISTYSPSLSDEALEKAGVSRASTIEDLFSSNDVIVELAPLTPKTEGMVNEKILRLIKPGGVFVNVGRGAVVDEEALVRVASEGKIQVALDVFTKEPLAVDSPLRGMPNVTLQPHIAGPTKDRRSDCGEVAVRNLEQYFAGQPMESEVTLDVYDRAS